MEDFQNTLFHSPTQLPLQPLSESLETILIGGREEPVSQIHPFVIHS